MQEWCREWSWESRRTSRRLKESRPNDSAAVTSSGRRWDLEGVGRIGSSACAGALKLRRGSRQAYRGHAPNRARDGEWDVANEG